MTSCVPARMRAASMCSFLVEKGPNLGKKYDTKGLFLHTVATYFEEESDKCKSQLESLIKILCIRHGEKEKMESAPHHLVRIHSVHFDFGAKIQILDMNVKTREIETFVSLFISIMSNFSRKSTFHRRLKVFHI